MPFKRVAASSDPYCRCKLGHQSHRRWVRTATKMKTLAPVFNEVLSLELERGKDGALLSSSLNVELYDWDLVGADDFLGAVTLDARRLAQEPGSTWGPSLFFFSSKLSAPEKKGV